MLLAFRQKRSKVLSLPYFDSDYHVFYYTILNVIKVTRLQFKRMVSPDFAHVMSLHAGEAYAMQNLTKTDRLGLLLSGKVSLR